MHVSTSRSVVIISGLLTLLVLSGGALGLAFHNGWLRTGPSGPATNAVSADSQASIVRPVSVGSIVAASPAADSAQTTTQDEAAVYRQKRDGSDERITNRDRDDDHRERQSRRYDSDHH